MNAITDCRDFDMPNRYRRMSPEELSQALDDLHLSAGQFARLAGSQRKRVLLWLEKSDARGEDIPHHIAVLCELLKLPGAMDIARRVTDEAIIETEES